MYRDVFKLNYQTNKSTKKAATMVAASNIL